MRVDNPFSFLEKGTHHHRKMEAPYLWPQMLIFVHRLPTTLQWVKGVCSARLPQTGQSPPFVFQGPLGSLPEPQLCIEDKLQLWLTTEGRFLQSLICYSSKLATIARSPMVVSGFFLFPDCLPALFQLSDNLHFLFQSFFLFFFLQNVSQHCLRCFCPISFFHFLLTFVSSASPIPASESPENKQTN